MKKIINILAVAGLALGFASCKTDLDRPQVTPVSGAGSISVNTDDPFVCTAENAADTAFVITWEAADFGNSVPVSYTLQIAVDGTDFANTVDMVVGNAKIKALISDDLNSLMHRFGLPIDTPTDLKIRIISKPSVLGSSSPQLPEIISEETLTINVSSFAMGHWHMIGAIFAVYGTPGFYSWDNTNYRYVMFRDDPLSVSTFTSNFFAFNPATYIGEFTFISDKNLGTWDFNGRIADGVLSPTPGGGNLKDIPSDGYHTVEADFSKFTYKITPYDASGATVYTGITMSGTAIASSTPMSVAVYDDHMWVADGIVLTEGTLQFEANDGTKWGGATFPWGKYEAGNETVNVLTAGTYFIRFSDLTGHYIFYKHP